MTKIKIMYQTSDGETFESEQEAIDHQSKVNVWVKILDEFGIHGTLEINYLEDFLELIKFYEENK